MQIRVAFLCVTLLMLTVLLIFSFLFSITRTVNAHVAKNFGNIVLEIGWSNEPALVGELNNVIVQINQTTSGKNSQTPVINALANMDIMIKYGGVTKPIDFVPSEQAEGLYDGQLIPTRVGSYSIVLNGTIKDQKIINTEIPLDLIQSKQKLNFPDSARSTGDVMDGTSNSAVSNNNNIGPQFQRIVSQFANDIDSIKNTIGMVAKTNVDTQRSIRELNGSSDMLYMIGMGGVGAGIAGIVMAAVALSRKEILKS